MLDVNSPSSVFISLVRPSVLRSTEVSSCFLTLEAFVHFSNKVGYYLNGLAHGLACCGLVNYFVSILVPLAVPDA